MEKLNLPQNIIDDVNEGRLLDKIIDYIDTIDIGELRREIRYFDAGDLLRYFKAYILNEIATAKPSDFAEQDESVDPVNSMYHHLLYSETKVTMLLSNLMSKIIEANRSRTSNQALLVMKKGLYLSIKTLSGSPAYNELSKYDDILRKNVIKEIEIKNYQISPDDLFETTKCLLAFYQLRDSDSVVGVHAFLRKAIIYAHDLFVDADKNINEFISEKNEGKELVRKLGKIIDANKIV